MMLGSKAFDPSDTGLLCTACSRISALLRSVLNMCHWHIAPWHHVMYRKKELAVCSASSFKQKIKSAEGGT